MISLATPRASTACPPGRSPGVCSTTVTCAPRRCSQWASAGPAMLAPVTRILTFLTFIRLPCVTSSLLVSDRQRGNSARYDTVGESVTTPSVGLHRSRVLGLTMADTRTSLAALGANVHIPGDPTTRRPTAGFRCGQRERQGSAGLGAANSGIARGNTVYSCVLSTTASTTPCVSVSSPLHLCATDGPHALTTFSPPTCSTCQRHRVARSPPQARCSTRPPARRRSRSSTTTCRSRR